jgi:hypothetical protein
MIVYTVTVVDVVSDPLLGNRRTPAIFTSLDKAVANTPFSGNFSPNLKNFVLLGQ